MGALNPRANVHLQLVHYYVKLQQLIQILIKEKFEVTKNYRMFTNLIRTVLQFQRAKKSDAD